MKRICGLPLPWGKAVAALGALTACGNGVPDGVIPPKGGGDLALAPVVSGLTDPTSLTAPAGDRRLFIAQQGGRILVADDGTIRPVPFLDLTAQVGSGGERGLFSLAFDPAYRSTGRVYVSYTDTGGNSRLDRFTVSADPDRLDPASQETLLQVTQPFPNHNGGQVAFGPDGMLYLGLGDGGSANDPQGNGQNPATLLGSLLRLDVSGVAAVAPPDNPFVGNGTARDEIWAIGLRNPWRFSFDEVTGLLYIGDVGQGAFEEVNVRDATLSGLNYGWNTMEGRECRPGGGACNQAGLELPALVYENTAANCAVVGGFVYRGTAIPELMGQYFYSDFCGGWLRSFRYENGVATAFTDWTVPGVGAVRSLGVDGSGELFVLTDTTVYRIVRAGSGG